MKIVISPAKSLDFESSMPTERYSQPLFLDEAEKLNSVLAKKKPKALSELMGISDQLADLNWKRNQEFSRPFTRENARPAVFAFNGDVYQGLDEYTLKESQMDRLQDTLRILSGLYGVLRPLDLIQPYRLEMGTKLKVGRKKNLYDFWKETITAELNSELKEGELFVNLASNEYFSAVDAKALKVPVITPVFKESTGEGYRNVTIYAKKARGMMLRFLIQHRISEAEYLKAFDEEGYLYHSDLSTPDQWVFCR